MEGSEKPFYISIRIQKCPSHTVSKKFDSPTSVSLQLDAPASVLGIGFFLKNGCKCSDRNRIYDLDLLLVEISILNQRVRLDLLKKVVCTT